MKNPFKDLFDYERPETSGEVLFFRLFELFVLGASIHLAWQWGLYTRRISDMVQPLGIAHYVDVSFLYGSNLPLVNAALLTALLLAGFFRRSRYAYFVAFLLMHLQFVTRFSLGKIPHSSNLVGMTLLGLSLALLLFHDAKHQRRFTFGFTYFFLGLGYTLAAYCKLIGTGIFWPDGRHLWLWLYEKGIDAYAWTGVFDFNGLQDLALSEYTVATLFLTVGLVTEFFAFLMWWRRFRTPLVLGVLGLHVGIYLTMGIMFYLTFYELILLAFPWAVWIDRLLRVKAAQSFIGFARRLALPDSSIS